MSTKRILIVDDEPDMRRSLRRILRLKGYDVETASSGEEAIETARSFDPHGVLMDVRMPGINGVEAYRRIRVDCPDTFVCFMTAHSDAANQAEQEGKHVFTKPLDIDQLCDLIAAEAADRPVLIVDDDPQFSASLKRVLANEGFRIDVAHNVDDAMEAFLDKSHAVVLLDIQLGAASGWDLVPALRQRRPDVCVIAISGVVRRQSPPDVNESVVFMPKPLDLNRLISTLHDSMEQE